MENNDWDAKDYMNNSGVQQKWARELIVKLDLKGNEAILDIGCGDGKITAEIAERLPDGYITGVDKSRDMIETARESFPKKKYNNLDFKKCDAEKLEFTEEFDIVFSNATLHWIKEHIPVL